MNYESTPQTSETYPTGPSSILPLLPVEIWDIIIDLSANYKSCALTCKSWTKRAQHNIFRSIRISGRAKLGRLLDSLRRRPENGGLIESLDMQEPNSLGFFPKMEFLEKQVVFSNAPYPYMILVELSPYLSNLRRITIGGHTRSLGDRIPPSPARLPITADTSQSFMDALVKQKSTLQELNLTIIRFGSLDIFSSIVYSFPDLRILSARECNIEGDTSGSGLSAHTSTIPPKLPRLPIRSLTISNSDNDQGVVLCQWILNGRLALHVSTLELSCIDCSLNSQYAVLAGRLIEGCGPSLRTLKLELCNVYKIARAGFFSLARNPSLETLHIAQVVSSSTDHQRTKRLHWLISILSSASPHNVVRNIEIELRMPDNPHATDDHSIKSGSKLHNDFIALDDLIVSEKFGKLEHVYIHNTVVSESLLLSLEGALFGEPPVPNTINLKLSSKLFPVSNAKNIMTYTYSNLGYTGSGWNSGRPDPDSEDDV